MNVYSYVHVIEGSFLKFQGDTSEQTNLLCVLHVVHWCRFGVQLEHRHACLKSDTFEETPLSWTN